MYGGGIGGLIGLGLAFYGLRRGMRYRQSMNETITTGIVLEEGEVTPVH